MRQQKLSEAKPHTEADGSGSAIRHVRIMRSRETEEMFEDFQRLNTDKARLAFAQHWLGHAAMTFERGWPLVYELGHMVKESGSYRESAETFEAFWAEHFGKAFGTWTELESTHHFARDAGLLDKTLSEVKLAQHGGARAGAGRPDGSPNGVSKESSEPVNNQPCEPKVDYGSAEYWRLRAQRDRPDLSERIATGEITPGRAAVEAGWMKPRNPVTSALAWVRRMTAEELYDFESKFNDFLQQRKPG